MALSSNSKVQPARDSLRVKRSYPANAETFYSGQVVMISPAAGRVTAVSASTEPGTTVVGMVVNKQIIAVAGDQLEVEAGYFHVSSSGFTGNETNARVWTADGVTFYDAQTTVANSQLAGRFKGFTTVGNGSANCIIEIGQTVSGSTI